MSKWTDVRDNVVDALHVDDVTEDDVADGDGLTNVLKTY